MAPSPLRSKSHFHARSVSLPSRSHPLIPQFNDSLCRLKSSESTSSSSLPSISNRLSSLEDLYDCIDDLLLLPHTQQSLAQGCNEKWFNNALDGYLKVLDGCAKAKDIFSQTKEDVTELLSLLRRKRDANNVGGYLASRKKMKKAIEKLMTDLKRKNNDNNMDNKDEETVSSFSKLSEVEVVTLAVLESLLSYAVVGTKLQPKRGGWSLVSKLMKHEIIKSEAREETVLSEFEEVDEAVNSLVGRKSCENYKNIETLQSHLVNLELTVQGIEEVLEQLIRRLIKTRVFLLNILNH